MWQYGLFDLFDEDDPETWALSLAEQGWEYATKRTGVLVEVNSVQRRRYYLRRWVEPRDSRSHRRPTSLR